jgi:DNA-binding CsgD family transcriptional regulator
MGRRRLNGRRPFTPREGEVVAGLLRGERRQDIARTLALSEETVKTHLTGIYHKLGVRTRLGAVVALAPSRARGADRLVPKRSAGTATA